MVSGTQLTYEWQQECGIADELIAMLSTPLPSRSVMANSKAIVGDYFSTGTSESEQFDKVEHIKSTVARMGRYTDYVSKILSDGFISLLK